MSCGFTSVLADDSPSSALEKNRARRGRNRSCSHLGLVRRGFFGAFPKVGGIELF